MSCQPRLASHKVFGSNNWYYTYGKSSQEEILNDTRLIVSLCERAQGKPYMVIDNGGVIFSLKQLKEKLFAKVPGTLHGKNILTSNTDDMSDI